MEKNLQGTAAAVNRPSEKNQRRFGYEFYRDNFRRMTVLAMILLGLDIVIVLAMIFVFRAQPEQELYATTRNGLLVRLRQFDGVSEIRSFQQAKALKQSAKNP